MAGKVLSQGKVEELLNFIEQDGIRLDSHNKKNAKGTIVHFIDGDATRKVFECPLKISIGLYLRVIFSLPFRSNF